jgi:glycosyltransferase involved in cell wall biosynthesis
LNLLLFNLGMDAAHPALGHATAWTNQLARRCAHVSVITMFVGDVSVERNVTVYSLGKELGRSEPRRLIEFYRLVYRALRERQLHACFAHMAPLFAALFAPVGKSCGIPTLLWYAHGSVSPTLRLAHALADRCVTSTPTGFRLPSKKLFVVGQGIDTGIFAPPSQTDPQYARTAISVGRITATKRIDEMLEALALLRRDAGLELRLRLVGTTLTEADGAYEAMLRRLARSLEVDEHVSFEGSVPYYEVARSYHHGGLFLNLSTKSLDKAILESMAAGCVPISRNDGFQALAREHGLEWLVPGPGPAGLAQCIAHALERIDHDRRKITRRLREVVEREHSLDSLSARLMAHLCELAGAARHRRLAPGREGGAGRSESMVE